MIDISSKNASTRSFATKFAAKRQNSTRIMRILKAISKAILIKKHKAKYPRIDR